MRKSLEQIETLLASMHESARIGLEITKIALDSEPDIALYHDVITILSANSEESTWIINIPLEQIKSVWCTGFASSNLEEKIFSKEVLVTEGINGCVVENHVSGDIVFEYILLVNKPGTSEVDWKSAKKIENKLFALWKDPEERLTTDPDKLPHIDPPLKTNEIHFKDLELISEPKTIDGDGKKVEIRNMLFQGEPGDKRDMLLITNASEVIIENSFVDRGMDGFGREFSWGTNALELRSNTKVIIKNIGARGGHTGIKDLLNGSVEVDGFVSVSSFKHQLARKFDNPGKPNTWRNGIIHGHPDRGKPDFPAMGNMDLISTYDCRGSQERPMLLEDIFIYFGWGIAGCGCQNGDGGDIGRGTTGIPGGFQNVNRIASFDTGGSGIGNSGGQDIWIRNSLFYSDQNSSSHDWANVGMSVGDFNSIPPNDANLTDTNWGGGGIENCRGTWYSRHGHHNAFIDHTTGFYSDRLKYWMMPAHPENRRPIQINNDFGPLSVTKEQILEKGKEFSQKAPVFIGFNDRPIVIEAG